MPTPDKFLANYDQLAQIAQRFGREAEATQRMLDTIRSAMNVLEGGVWVGQGARAFYAEMNSAVLPSLMRLTRALANVQRVTIQISREIKAAEDAAAAVLHDDGATGSTSGGTKALYSPEREPESNAGLATTSEANTNFASQTLAANISVPMPSGPPPMPVPGSPDGEWKWNPNPQNSRGGS